MQLDAPRDHRGRLTKGYPNPKGPNGRFISRFERAIRESQIDRAVCRALAMIGFPSQARLAQIKFDLPKETLERLPLTQSVRYAFNHPDDLDFKILRPWPPESPGWEIKGERPVPKFLRIGHLPTTGAGFSLPDLSGSYCHESELLRDLQNAAKGAIYAPTGSGAFPLDFDRQISPYQTSGFVRPEDSAVNSGSPR